jgi:ATP-binding protein involved in chromosome partitioning
MAARKLAEKMNVPLLGQIPLVQGIREGSDSGEPVALTDTLTGQAFMNLAGEVVSRVEQRNREMMPTMKVKMNK